MAYRRSHRQPPVLISRIGVIAAIGLALMAWAPALALAVPQDALPALSAEEQAEAKARRAGKDKLARLLESRVAGTPVRCLAAHPNISLRQVDGTAYIFRRGSTIWVQRTESPENIRRGEALLTNRLNGVEMCRNNVFSTFDPVAGFLTGNVQFVDFVPYTLGPAKTRSDG